MGVAYLTIIFDKQNGTYSPGEMVTGKVVMVLDGMTKIRGIELLIEGRAKCQWTDSYRERDRHGNYHTVYYERLETETYLQKFMILIGGTGEGLELLFGKYSYPFSVKIPPRAPSSYIGTYGSIMYSANVKIDIPWGFDSEHTSYFKVIRLMNLHFYPGLRRAPLLHEDSQTFCCWCCASQPLTIIVRSPKAFFAQSESIPITLDVNNASYVTIRFVSVYLKRQIVFRAGRYRKYINASLTSGTLIGRVPGHQSFSVSKNLEIPPNFSYPYLGGCSIIDFEHSLHIEVDVEGLHSNLDTYTPIVIVDRFLNEDPNTREDEPPSQTDPNTDPISGSSLLPPQPYTYPESSKNGPYPRVISPGESSNLPPSDTNNAKLENSSLLNDFKDSNAINTTVSTTLMPSSFPSVPTPY